MKCPAATFITLFADLANFIQSCHKRSSTSQTTDPGSYIMSQSPVQQVAIAQGQAIQYNQWMQPPPEISPYQQLGSQWNVPPSPFAHEHQHGQMPAQYGPVSQHLQSNRPYTPWNAQPFEKSAHPQHYSQAPFVNVPMPDAAAYAPDAPKKHQQETETNGQKISRDKNIRHGIRTGEAQYQGKTDDGQMQLLFYYQVPEKLQNKECKIVCEFMSDGDSAEGLPTHAVFDCDFSNGVQHTHVSQELAYGSWEWQVQVSDESNKMQMLYAASSVRELDITDRERVAS